MKFAEKVYGLCKKIPKGKVSTYKEIGKALKRKGMVYRAVGVALKNNKHAPVIPCHRVVKSGGFIGGYHGKTSGPWLKKKIALLKKEGVSVKNSKIVDFKKKLHKY